MPSLDQARAAFEAVRALADRPVVVSLTFTEEGTTFYGDKPEDVVRAAEEWGVAVVGANCSQGPQPMLETVQRMAAAATRVKISAMPNAGAPALVDGRYVYLCTPEYMASYARRFLGRRRDHRRRLLRHHARAHPQPGALGAHGAAGARGGRGG